MTSASRQMRIAFMGTPDFAVPTLQALIDAGHDIVAVYSQPPSRAGRGKKVRNSPVHALAENEGIEVRTPASLRSKSEQEAFRDLDLDLAVVVAYGQILPIEILDATKFGCVNIHASLLPRWRGAAPIHRAIMAGDSQTGICIMKMDEGLDTGPVIARASTVINASTTTAELHDELAMLGAEMINEAIVKYCEQGLIPIEQDSHGITYANKIDKSEACIDWTKPAAKIDQLVRGLNPFPGAYTTFENERIKVLSGTIEEAKGQPGITLDDQMLIACGTGAFRISKAQRAGKAAMLTDDFLRGLPIAKASQFGS